MKDENNTLNDFNKYDIFEKWKKLQNFPTLGMFSVLNKDYNEYMEDLITLNKILMDFRNIFPITGCKCPKLNSKPLETLF